MFNSVLTYCISLWVGLNKFELEDLQILQNKAIRVVTRMPPRSNRKQMFEETGYMTLNQLIFYHTVLNIFKIRKVKEPEYLYNLISNENIREQIIHEKTNLTLTTKGFIFRGIENWNSIPPDIKNNTTISRFKNQVQGWINKNIPFSP